MVMVVMMVMVMPSRRSIYVAVLLVAMLALGFKLKRYVSYAVLL